MDPVGAFREEVRRGWRGDMKGPFNVDDREKAGLTREFYEDLRGEMGTYPDPNFPADKKIGLDIGTSPRDAVAAVPVAYEKSC